MKLHSHITMASSSKKLQFYRYHCKFQVAVTSVGCLCVAVVYCTTISFCCLCSVSSNARDLINLTAVLEKQKDALELLNILIY